MCSASNIVAKCHSFEEDLPKSRRQSRKIGTNKLTSLSIFVQLKKHLELKKKKEEKRLARLETQKVGLGKS